MTQQPQPASSVKIRSLDAKPLDENRIRAILDLEEAETSADLVFILNDANDRELSRAVIMNNRDSHVEFTLHLRQQNFQPPISLTCTAYQVEDIPLDSLTIQVK